MEQAIQRLTELLEAGQHYIAETPHSEMLRRSKVDKWSKQEILGHLIDSALHNLQRFNEVQFEDKPYRIRTYRQDDLVTSNAYQSASKEELLDLWVALNRRILAIMQGQNLDTLAFPVNIGKVLTDLRFLMTDYVEHMEHHLAQILEEIPAKVR